MFSFGQKPLTTAAPTSSLIQGSTQPATSAFGTSTAPLTFGAKPISAGFGVSTTQNQPPPTSTLVSSFSSHPFQYIQQCYDTNSLNYRFRVLALLQFLLTLLQTYFYNSVPGGVVKYAISKPNTISDRLWTQICNDNPDPESMIPIIANGFEDLRSRASWQDEQLAAQKNKLTVPHYLEYCFKSWQELEGKVGTFLKKVDLDMTSQLQQIQRQQLKLIKRILSVFHIFWHLPYHHHDRL